MAIYESPYAAPNVSPWFSPKIPQNANPGAQYIRPNQAKSSTDYANALLKNSQEPIHHWTQGVQHMVEALTGGALDYNTGLREKATSDYAAGQGQRYGALQTGQVPPEAAAPASGTDPNATPYQYPNAPFPGAQKSTEGDTNNVGGNKDSWMAFAQKPYEQGGLGLAPHQAAGLVGNLQQESGGGVPSWGPTGDHGTAWGAAQWRNERLQNLFQFSAAHGMDPHSTEAQQAFMRDELSNRYLQTYGALRNAPTPEAAASIFNHGYEISADRSGQREANARGLYSHAGQQPSVFGSPNAPANPGQALAFDGTPSNEAPAAQAIDQALAFKGGGGGAKSPAPSTGAPVPAQPGQPIGGAGAILGTGQPTINPAMIHAGRGMTDPSFREILSNPYSRPEMVSAAINMGLAEGQPIEMPVPGGKMIIDRRNPNNQYFVPDIHWGEATNQRKVGELEKRQSGPVPSYMQPNGGVMGGMLPQAPPQAAPAPAPAPTGPRSEAVPQSGGANAYAAENAPAAPAAAAKGTQVASLNPAIGSKPETPALATPTPPSGPQVAQNAGQTPLGRWGGNNFQPPPEGSVTAEDWADLQTLNRNKLVGEQNKARLESGIKAYDEFNKVASAAQQLEPKVQESINLMSDPNFHAGMAAGLQDTWSRFKEAFMGEAGANMPNETFDKLASGNVLDTMKTALGGLGQVRLAEINLLSKANANRFYGVAANRAVLDITQRGLQKIGMLRQMAQQYNNGQEVVDPVTGKVLMKAGDGTRLGLDGDFDQLASKWAEEQNKRDADHYKKYEEYWKTGKDPETGEQDQERGGKKAEGEKNKPTPGGTFNYDRNKKTFTPAQ